MNRSKTYAPKQEEIKRNWYIVNARGKILGRLASKIAVYLQGKHKPDYTPYLDMGDEVIVINAREIVTTGKKNEDKKYKRYSGYPGGLKETPLKTMKERHPERILELAVKGMLPKNRLASRMINRLRIYEGQEYPHNAQKPKPLEI
jgi:large subunit ribosomal protein L13